MSIEIWMDSSVAQGVVVMGGILAVVVILTATGTLGKLFPRRPDIEP